MTLLAKDFIETTEKLIFAVVESGLEQDKALCFLRYIFKNQQWKKVNTDQANHYLNAHYPYYLHYSSIKQAHCHAVDLKQIHKHHQPKAKLHTLLLSPPTDKVEEDLLALCHLFAKQGFPLDAMGVTGSVLISAQNPLSDIDLVFYCLDRFNQARHIVKQLIKQGECHALSDEDWQQSYQRRECDLSYADYFWHEKRKFNKAVINHRKFDLSFVSTAHSQTTVPPHYQKIQAITLQVHVTDDLLAFDYPSELGIKHPTIQSIVCYTATYTGQAFKGEWIEVSGQLERSSLGNSRIIVGSSREATGEYIKVIHEKN